MPRKIHNISKDCPIEAIDLFCGAGGLTYGLRAVGIDVKLGVDADSACAYPYEVNNRAKFICADIADVTGQQLERVYSNKNIRLLAGCAPCQTFSSYNHKATDQDKRWWLLLEFLRLIKEMQPELVTMENVPGLVAQEVFSIFLAELKELGYFVHFQIVRCEKYGLPQSRRRLVLLASKLGDIALITPEEFGVEKEKTVFEAIGLLPAIAAGAEHFSGDVLHQSASLSPLNLSRIRSSKPGGSWKDWPSKLVSACHKKQKGSTFSSVYGRMRWDTPSPTITTQFYSFGSGRFGHPEQDRALSLREGAILQGFPEDYKFLPEGKNISRKVVGRMIGNAVPVDLGKVIGSSFKKHLCELKIERDFP